MRRRLIGTLTGWKLRWNAGASARVHSHDRRFSDEDILQILRAGEAGLKVADVCAAENIPAKTYYLWKVKYTGLTLSELRRRRLRERWYRRTAVVLAAVVVLGIGYVIVVELGPSAAEQSVSRPEGRNLRGDARAPAGHASLESRGNQPVDIAAPATRVDAEDIRTADPDGYAIQVAAVSTLQDARNVVARLAAGGYAAYLTRTTAGQGEMYRVRVGPLESRQLAEETAHRLERDGHRGLWITK